MGHVVSFGKSWRHEQAFDVKNTVRSKSQNYETSFVHLFNGIIYLWPVKPSIKDER